MKIIGRTIAFLIALPTHVVMGMSESFYPQFRKEVLEDQESLASDIDSALFPPSSQTEYEREHCVDFRTGKPQC